MKLKILLVFLVLLLVPIASATLTRVLNAPANLLETTATSVLFNQTVNSTVNVSLPSYLQIYSGTAWVTNESVTCTNATACNVTVTGFPVGFHNWRFTTDENGTNSSSDSRWFEIRGSYNKTYFVVQNDSGFKAMTLDKDAGDLWIAGGFNMSAGGLEVLNLTVGGGYGDTGLTVFDSGSLWTNGDILLDGTFITINGQIVNGSMYPILDDTFELGNSSLRWKSVTAGTGVSSFAGNVGVGTTNPVEKLDVVGSGVTRIKVNSSGDNAEVRLHSDTGNNAFVSLYELGTSKWLVGNFGSDDSYRIARGTSFASGVVLKFDTSDNANFTKGDVFLTDDKYLGISGDDVRIVFDSGNDIELLGGNVGVGTTSPIFKLDVDGDVALNLTSTNRLILPSSNDAVTPTLSFGDGDSGIYEKTDDNILIALGGGEYWNFGTSSFRSPNSNGPEMFNRAATATTPTFVPRDNDEDTGIGSQGADNLSLIAGGFEQLRLGTNFSQFKHDAWIRGVDSAGSGSVNMFKVNSNDEIEVGGTLVTGGSFEFAEDSGQVTAMNMPVSSSAADGTEESYSFSLDSDVVAKVKASSDGAGGVDEKQFLVVNGSAATPSISFIDDSDTGFYMASNGQISTSLGGGQSWIFTGGAIRGNANAYPRMMGENPSATNPTFVPNGNDQDTGIGRQGDDNLSLIAGGVEGVRIGESGSAITVDVKGDLTIPTNNKLYLDGGTNNYIYGDASGINFVLGGTTFGRITSTTFTAANDGFFLKRNGVSSTNPTIGPYDSDLDTGIGQAGADNLSLIAGAWEGIRVSEGVNDRVYIGLDSGSGVGGYITSNSTCLVLHSPDGTGETAICNV